MIVAIPTVEGRLHEHFGGSNQFAIAEADPAKHKILGIRAVTASPDAPGLFPRLLQEPGAKVVIADGIGRHALSLFAHPGIIVRAGTAGVTVEDLAGAWLNGQWVAEHQGCAHHDNDAGGHHHSHE